MIFFLFSLSLSENSVRVHGFISVIGNRLVDQNWDLYALRGVSLNFHNFAPQFYSQNVIRQIASEWKSSVVRASINDFDDNPENAFQKLDLVVQAAIVNSIYVIIDYNTFGPQLDKARTFFRRVASTYSRYPNIIYEILHDSGNFIQWPELKDYSIDLIRVIRAIDPFNLILVPSPHSNQDIHLVANSPITGYKNIAYACRFVVSHQQWFRDRIVSVLDRGLPLFVTECGPMDPVDGPLSVQDWNEWNFFLKDHLISWVAWHLGNEEVPSAMLRSTANVGGEWRTSDLEEWGVTVRDTLMKGNV